MHSYFKFRVGVLALAWRYSSYRWVVAISTAHGRSCLFPRFLLRSIACSCCPAATGAFPSSIDPASRHSTPATGSRAASSCLLRFGRSNGLFLPRLGRRMRGEANGEEARQQPRPPRGEEEQEQEQGEEEEQRQLPPQQRQHGNSQRNPSSGQQQPVTMRNVGYVGKHRLSAAIARLDQELQSLQDELNELETMEHASAACQEVITSTEGKPDPLLPITSGPENSSWDRWFQRVRSSRSNKWWASKGSDFS